MNTQTYGRETALMYAEPNASVGSVQAILQL